MDFQFTSRPSENFVPVWKTPATPMKRTHTDMNPPLTPSSVPTFGTNASVPFIFQSPPPKSAYVHAWAPPDNFSPEKAFPQEEIRDVDMAEPSPPKPQETNTDGRRTMALGAVRRVFKSRQKARSKALARTVEENSEESSASDDESDDEHLVSRRSRVQKLSHHYTLNMPSPPPSKTDTPYVLLGYLQFLFNSALVFLFLYLLVKFILTVQRDVEQRITEYSMDIVQEISNCAAHYKANLCGSNPVPAMFRQCSVWETCMNRDPTVVGRAKVGAELIAEVINGFVEPISWKTLAFTLSSLASMTIFVNSLLSLFRSRLSAIPEQGSVRQEPLYPLQPPTPYPMQLSRGSGWRQGSWDDELIQTPSRRRRLENGGTAKVS
ncbi:Di-sulfide bridge nucleocytoplasmic transport domain-containing protein [Multifurca ochricompacta]|uniref:Di-sulfide bridge nucleocytoplasmic transport domain-containing protein n=1 Tax=Multifurca ochricompacta TaxID=376703 RepID=A0AAD4QTF7_9AGAM|nr:Di-sulfide bridge nucleocytoplasmic transport domain-containing protein [Multifurca ochricompacta]